MILQKEIHHPNDITNRYLIEIMPEKLHDYLGLPGKFLKNYPTRIILRDGSQREMDWLMLVEPDNETLFEKILINVEFQSSAVTEDKIKALMDYKDYAKTYYGLPVLTVVVITKGYDSSVMEYSKVSSDILRPEYIQITQEEIIERLNNLDEKIENHSQLSDNEALDIVLLPMFASKSKAEMVTEKITHLFALDKSLTGIFRHDIAFAFSIMIKKYFDCTSKGVELLKMLGAEISNSRLREVVDFEVAYTIKALEKQIEEKDNVIVEKDNEIILLKAKLAENGIKY